MDRHGNDKYDQNIMMIDVNPCRGRGRGRGQGRGQG